MLFEAPSPHCCAALRAFRFSDLRVNTISKKLTQSREGQKQLWTFGDFAVRSLNPACERNPGAGLGVRLSFLLIVFLK
jgi:hypothetical protein